MNINWKYARDFSEYYLFVSDEYYTFFRSLVGGVINKPAIDSSGDIHEFCQNLKKLCLKNDVTIKTDTGVKEILTEGYGKK